MAQAVNMMNFLAVETQRLTHDTKLWEENSVETLNLIGSVCSIISLLVALFVAVKVYKISISIGNTINDSSKSKQSGNIVGGDQAGRDIKKGI